MPPTTPRYNPRLLGLGLLAGAALGVAYVNTKQKQYAQTGAPKLMDWNRVGKLAHQIIKEDTPDADWYEKWHEYYRGMVARCYPVITEEMGRELPVPIQSIQAFTRTEWIDANIANFRQLFDPIENMYRRMQSSTTVGTALMGEVNQLVLSSEVGVLLGYLARRVLGQYDLSLLGKEPVTEPGRLYFVEPNINAVCTELGLDPDDFRLWIALHETTHAYEFEAYPWVREYFNALLEEYFGYLSDDLTNLSAGLGGVRSLVDRARSNLNMGDSWIEMVMTSEQRALFNKLQALMSIIEGYSNYIMNAVGERLLPSFKNINERIEQRNLQRSTAEKLFTRITGLALKLEQYRLGETFIFAVVGERGVQFANQVWDGPEMLPTLEELRDPKSWIQRVDAAKA